MKRLGRDKAYFKHNKGSLSTLLLEKFERCVDNNLNAENPYLHYILYHRFAKLPFYLEKENFEIIKRNIHKITIRKVEFSDILKENKQYDLMYLSDIFEYMDERVMTQMTADITRCLTPGGNVLLFNMMNHRRLGAPLQESRVDQTRNRTFYYMDCYLYRK
jgi:S-adenosylmethionine-diacylglycerol 3-amino-3-carboxypropyl transferase